MEVDSQILEDQRVTSQRHGQVPSCTSDNSGFSGYSDWDIDEIPIRGFTNTRALSKNSSTYELEKFKRNFLIIINQYHFYDESMSHHMTRKGTKNDAEALRDTFEKLNFEIHEYQDYKKKEIFDSLKKTLHQDWSDYGCIAIAILTHGSDNGKLYARDQVYYETDIIDLLTVKNNPSLITKPKVIIIQACRGTNKDPGVPVFGPIMMATSGSLNGLKDGESDVNTYFIPAESDMFIIHSSTAGNVSYRNIETGSWFIQELCSKINTLSETMDLQTIMTAVKRDIAINMQHTEFSKQGIEIFKQMPVVTSTLLRKLYFRKYSGAQSHNNIIETKDGRLGKVIRMPVNWVTDVHEDSTCPCCVEHFNYMKNCLKYYLEENPDDGRAINYLMLANTLEDSEEFNKPKEKMNKIISRHLKRNAVKCPFFKYVYFNNH